MEQFVFLQTDAAAGGNQKADTTDTADFTAMVKAKSADLVKKVNAVASSAAITGIGIDQLKPLVNDYYSICELINKKLDGAALQTVDIINAVAPVLYPVLVSILPDGAIKSLVLAPIDMLPNTDPVDFQIAFNQLNDLDDQEIIELINQYTSFDLGDNAIKFRQGLKFFLTGWQTKTVFSK